MMLKLELFIILLLSLASCTSPSNRSSDLVRVIGEMKNAMWKGQLHGNIDLDTISNKVNLYGLGPLENLAGEIMIINGKSYKSTVLSEGLLQVEESYTVKAPFFAYANISEWKEYKLPDSVLTISQLELYLGNTAQSLSQPFMFKLIGKVAKATIHCVNLPEGAKVSSPEEAHQGRQNYLIENEDSEILGFYSTQHKGIFTHHNTFVHMHLITTDRQKMGHLDDVLFDKGSMKLFLPSE